MRLSAKEKKILACMELQAEMPIAEVRSKTRFRDHSIRYGIKRLEDRGAISKFAAINIGAMGYSIHNLYFSLTAEHMHVKDKFSDYLFRSKNTVWVGEFSGDYQYGVGICCKDLLGLYDFLDVIITEFGQIFNEKQSSTQFRAFRFPRSYLAHFEKSPLVLYERSKTKIDIDALDHRILNTLSHNGGVPLRTLASALAVPLSTLSARIRRLEDRNVIEGYAYHVDARCIQTHEFKLLLYTNGVSEQLFQTLHNFALENEHVTMLVECFGAWDFEMNIEVPQSHGITSVTQELCKKLTDKVRSIKTLTKFRDIKHVALPTDLFEN